MENNLKNQQFFIARAGCMCSIQHIFHKDAMACGGGADLHIGDCAHGAPDISRFN